MPDDFHIRQEDKNEKFIAIAKFALFLVIIVGIPFYIYFFHRDFITSFKSVDDIKNYLAKYEVASSFVYIGLQILHVVISVIPAQPFHLASGYVFGFWSGYLLSIAGIAIGTTATFYLARLLGKDAMYLFFGEKKFVKHIDQMNSERALIVLFIIFLIPGLPKDPIGYAVGLSKIRLWQYLIVALAGRTPGIMGTIMLGSMIEDKSYTEVIILATAAALLCIIGLIYRKRITDWIERKHAAGKD